MAIDKVLRKPIEAGLIPGVVALAADDRGVFYQGAFGKRAVDKPEPMTLDSVFRIASMTKAVTGAAAIATLVVPLPQHVVGLEYSGRRVALPIIHSEACHHDVTRHRDQYIGSVRSVAVLRMNCVPLWRGCALGRQTQRPINQPARSPR
jgi:Beta-lactamase